MAVVARLSAACASFAALFLFWVLPAWGERAQPRRALEPQTKPPSPRTLSRDLTRAWLAATGAADAPSRRALAEVMRPSEAGSTRDRLKQRLELLKKENARLTQLVQVSRNFTKAAAASSNELFLLEEDSPLLWEQRKFRKHGGYGFVSYSAFRMKPGLISIVGFGRSDLRPYRRPRGCTWLWKNGSSAYGQLDLYYTQGLPRLYELVLMECKLRNKGGGDDYSSSEPGFLKVRLDNEVLYPFREEAGYSILPENSSGPFKYDLLYCASPVYGKAFVPAMQQWLDYHRYFAGIDHMILYDQGTLTNSDRTQLRVWIKQGLLTLIDFFDLLKFETLMQGQLVQMHDCLFRSRNIARWVMFGDFDEYLVVPPPATLPSLLRKHKEAVSFSHGCYEFSIEHCERDKVWDPHHDKFAVEMLLQRAINPHCNIPEEQPPTCFGTHGHRKFFVNPRWAYQLSVHSVVRPPTGHRTLHISEIWHGHFRGFQDPSNVCTQTKTQESKFDSWWTPEFNVTTRVRSTQIKDIAKRARECAKTDFRDKAKCTPVAASK